MVVIILSLEDAFSCVSFLFSQFESSSKTSLWYHNATTPERHISFSTEALLCTRLETSIWRRPHSSRQESRSLQVRRQSCVETRNHVSRRAHAHLREDIPIATTLRL